MVKMVPLSFADQEFRFTGGRALFWPREQALLVADLHLEKASFFASHGQFLPPYDSCETLERVALAIRETGARRVFTLGDNFHDADGPARLGERASGMLAALTRAVEWIWITGNHDAGNHDGDNPASTSIGGTFTEELEVGGMVLRHQARPEETRPELSGHFHPRLKVRVQKRSIRRACAVKSESASGGAARMILPAFGALTGGMDAGDPAILAAMQPASMIDAILPAGGRLAHFPLWRATS